MIIMNEQQRQRWVHDRARDTGHEAMICYHETIKTEKDAVDCLRAHYDLPKKEEDQKYFIQVATAEIMRIRQGVDLLETLLPGWKVYAYCPRFSLYKTIGSTQRTFTVADELMTLLQELGDRRRKDSASAPEGF